MRGVLCVIENEAKQPQSHAEYMQSTGPEIALLQTFHNDVSRNYPLYHYDLTCNHHLRFMSGYFFPNNELVPGTREEMLEASCLFTNVFHIFRNVLLSLTKWS